MALDTTPRGSVSGLSESEAKEFHSVFMTSFIVFVVVAIVAHILAYMWRPWAPPIGGYTTSLLDGVSAGAHHLISLVA